MQDWNKMGVMIGEENNIPRLLQPERQGRLQAVDLRELWDQEPFACRPKWMNEEAKSPIDVRRIFDDSKEPTVQRPLEELVKISEDSVEIKDLDI